jgi:hypothetical protein
LSLLALSFWAVNLIYRQHDGSTRDAFCAAAQMIGLDDKMCIYAKDWDGFLPQEAWDLIPHLKRCKRIGTIAEFANHRIIAVRFMEPDTWRRWLLKWFNHSKYLFTQRCMGDYVIMVSLAAQ